MREFASDNPRSVVLMVLAVVIFVLGSTGLGSIVTFDFALLICSSLAHQLSLLPSLFVSPSGFIAALCSAQFIAVTGFIACALAVFTTIILVSRPTWEGYLLRAAFQRGETVPRWALMAWLAGFMHHLMRIVLEPETWIILCSTISAFAFEYAVPNNVAPPYTALGIALTVSVQLFVFGDKLALMNPPIGFATRVLRVLQCGVMLWSLGAVRVQAQLWALTVPEGAAESGAEGISTEEAVGGLSFWATTRACALHLPVVCILMGAVYMMLAVMGANFADQLIGTSPTRKALLGRAMAHFVINAVSLLWLVQSSEKLGSMVITALGGSVAAFEALEISEDWHSWLSVTLVTGLVLAVLSLASAITAMGLLVRGAAKLDWKEINSVEARFSNTSRGQADFVANLRTVVQRIIELLSAERGAHDSAAGSAGAARDGSSGPRQRRGIDGFLSGAARIVNSGNRIIEPLKGMWMAFHAWQGLRAEKFAFNLTFTVPKKEGQSLTAMWSVPRTAIEVVGLTRDHTNSALVHLISSPKKLLRIETLKSCVLDPEERHVTLRVRVTVYGDGISSLALGWHTLLESLPFSMPSRNRGPPIVAIEARAHINRGSALPAFSFPVALIHSDASAIWGEDVQPPGTSLEPQLEEAEIPDDDSFGRLQRMGVTADIFADQFLRRQMEELDALMRTGALLGAPAGVAGHWQELRNSLAELSRWQSSRVAPGVLESTVKRLWRQSKGAAPLLRAAYALMKLAEDRRDWHAQHRTANAMRKTSAMLLVVYFSDMMSQLREKGSTNERLRASFSSQLVLGATLSAIMMLHGVANTHARDEVADKIIEEEEMRGGGSTAQLVEEHRTTAGAAASSPTVVVSAVSDQETEPDVMHSRDAAGAPGAGSREQRYVGSDAGAGADADTPGVEGGAWGAAGGAAVGATRIPDGVHIVSADDAAILSTKTMPPGYHSGSDVTGDSDSDDGNPG